MSKIQKTTATAAAARALDKFYTAPHCVDMCLSHLRRTLGQSALAAHDLWIEPSAGSGAFFSKLPSARIGIDIAPEHPDLVQADFLTWRPSPSVKAPIVIGNPPFGTNASLAVRFFNHAATFASRVAFILPRSFRKESIHNRLDAFFHLEAELDLPDNSFLFEGDCRDVRVVWQVWARRDEPRIIIHSPVTCADFAFCKPKDADFAIRRAGANAGAIYSEPLERNKNTHIFIRATGMPAETLRIIFEQLYFGHAAKNTASVKSIAQVDIVAIYSAWMAQYGRVAA